jgi:anaerobic dimethyl sulfoxide reductase subunit B (iron-sulfur subunit)
MNQWGFFFNQDRCLGCKTCGLACKSWNDDRRGDALINTYDAEKDKDKYSVAEGENERKDIYIDPDTSNTNYKEYGKYHMKENWRRISTRETGSTVLSPDFTFQTTVDMSHLSMSCNHCSKPACLDACPVGAIYKEESIGAVLVNMNICISCGKCRQVCPWDAPQYYDENFAQYALDNPKRPRMAKCNFCLDRINEGLKPMCVASCWNRALDAGPINELKKKYQDKGWTVSQTIAKQFEDLSTEPNILFKVKRP